jgi:hypothetical protein
MDLKALLTGLEANWLSVWVRESTSLLAFPTIIALHAIGMGLLVGANVALHLRVLGFARLIPLQGLAMLFPVMVFGFVVNTVSGILLLLAYPTKALTNPVFYVKLVLIALAVAAAGLFRKRILGKWEKDELAITGKEKIIAGASLAMWAAAIVAGRFLAYTYKYLTAFDIGLER